MRQRNAGHEVDPKVDVTVVAFVATRLADPTRGAPIPFAVQNVNPGTFPCERPAVKFLDEQE